MKIARELLNIPNNASYDEFDSPVGKLTIITNSEGLHGLLWNSICINPDYEALFERLSRSKSEPTMVQAKKQLTEYFEGIRQSFDLPLVLHGTSFQIQAWKQLLKIPYAKTISYSEQAAGIGNKNKARAVGLANGLNPISIVIPCHRVIGSNGSLTGFAGGIEKKAYLLALEKNNL